MFLYSSLQCLFERIFVGEFDLPAGGDAPAEAGELFCVPLELVLDDHGVEVAVGGRVSGDDDLVRLPAELFLDDALEVVHAEPLSRVEDAALGEFTDDQVAAREPSGPFYGHEVRFLFDDHNDVLSAVRVFADTTQASFVGVDEKAISAYLYRGKIHNGACRFVDLAFATADQKEGESGRLAWANAGKLCKYVDEVADLLREHGVESRI